MILGILKAGGAYVPLDPNYFAPSAQRDAAGNQGSAGRVLREVEDRLPAGIEIVSVELCGVVRESGLSGLAALMRAASSHGHVPAEYAGQVVLFRSFLLTGICWRRCSPNCWHHSQRDRRCRARIDEHCRHVQREGLWRNCHGQRKWPRAGVCRRSGRTRRSGDAARLQSRRVEREVARPTSLGRNVRGAIVDVTEREKLDAAFDEVASPNANAELGSHLAPATRRPSAWAVVHQRSKMGPI